jgi:hypothetical protein
VIAFLPALYIWLATVAIGLLAVFVARYFVDDDKSSIAGFSAAIGIAIGNSAVIERSAVEWWISLLGLVAGLISLWWHLFKKKEFRRG